MYNRPLPFVAAVAALLIACGSAHSVIVPSSITYQGQLSVADGAPAESPADMRFRLYNAASGGAQIGPEVSLAGQQLSPDGRFTVQLDFGAAAYDGNARWLEIDVRTPSPSGAYTTLTGRQQLTAVPYALYALSGNPGPQGATGPQGVAGPQGAIGPQGTRGPTGPTGPQGVMGSPGAQGATGAQGTSPFLLNGTSAYYNAGNLGLGTTNPSFQLDVSRADGNSARFASPSTLGAVVALECAATGGRNWSLISTGAAHPFGAGSLAFRDVSSGGDRFSLTAAGNVHVANSLGIGKSNPSSRLHVFDTASSLITIESGVSAAQFSAINFTDRGTSKFGLGKNTTNQFYIDQVGVGREMTVDTSGNIAFFGSNITNIAQSDRVVTIYGNSNSPGPYPGTVSLCLVNPVNGSSWATAVNTDGSFSFYHNGVGSNHVKVPVLEITGGADVAEPFDISGDAAVEVGMVVAIDPSQPGHLRLADTAYDATVAGVISGAGGVRAGLTLKQDNTAATGSHPVALSGRVYCWVDADAGGAVKPGDMLTTSATRGHAMKVSDASRADGAVIGKAMTPLESGKGLVLILVNLR